MASPTRSTAARSPSMSKFILTHIRSPARSGGSARGASGRAPRPRRDRTGARPASPRSASSRGRAVAGGRTLRLRRRRRPGRSARRSWRHSRVRRPPPARSSTCGMPVSDGHRLACGRVDAVAATASNLKSLMPRRVADLARDQVAAGLGLKRRDSVVHEHRVRQLVAARDRIQQALIHNF